MSRTLFLSATLLASLSPTQATAGQARVDVAGSVYCRPEAKAPEIPAANVLVEAVPDGDTAKSTFTQISDGYYRIPLRYRLVVDRNLPLQYFAGGYAVAGQTVFVSREKLSTLDRIPLFIVSAVEIVADCQNIGRVPPFGVGNAAQGTASIAGTVQSVVGRPLPNVAVRLRNLTTTQIVASTTTSGSTGAFKMVGLAAGNYAVEALNAAGEVIGVTTIAVVDRSAVTGVTVSEGARVATGTSGAAAGGFFGSTAGVLTLAAAAAGVAGATVVAKAQPVTSERLKIDAVSAGSTVGALLTDARTIDFASLGFRYAPVRNATAAIVTNPAASAFEADGWQVEAKTQLPARVLDVATTYSRGNGVTVGAGYFMKLDTEKRHILYDGGSMRDEQVTSTEHALIGFVAKRVSPRLSGSIGSVVQIQSVAQPESIQRDVFSDGSTVDTVLIRHDVSASADLSIGLAFQAFRSVRIGLAASNLAGSRQLVNGAETGARTAGAGIAWLHGRLQLGADIEDSEVGKLNASLGGSIVAARDLELGVGYITRQKTVSLRARLRWFDYVVRSSDASRWSHYVGGLIRF